MKHRHSARMKVFLNTSGHFALRLSTEKLTMKFDETLYIYNFIYIKDGEGNAN